MTIDDKLDLLCRNVQSINDNIIVLKSDVAELKSDVAELKRDMTKVKADIIELRSDMNTMEARINNKINQLSENVRGIRFTIENEIRPNIVLIADSHLILNTKLDEAIRTAGSIEMTRVRVGILEEDVKKLKKAVNI